MNKWFILFLLSTSAAWAQYSEYLYIVTPEQVGKNEWRAKYESAYAVDAVQPFGEDGVEQRVGTVYGISKRINLSAVASAVVDNGKSTTLGAAQVELMADLMPKTKSGLALSAGAGWLREYQGVQTALARAALSWQKPKWRLDANALLQKPFAENRDAVDVLFSLGANAGLSQRWRVGVEALGEDLEGFWEEEEAEGGAKLLLCTTLAWSIQEKLSLRLGAGPIYYLTRSNQDSQAPRMLHTSDTSVGALVRLSALYRI